MTVTTKYNELCKNYKIKLRTHGIQHEQDICELVLTDKQEYFESV